MLSRRLDIDLLEAAREKLAINQQRYPADRARGRADRASAYAQTATDTPPKSD